MGWFEREAVVETVEPINPNLSPIEYLLARMRDPRTEEHTRTKIAIALLPFTSPKLMATATIALGQDFVSKLERAIMRSAQARLTAEARATLTAKVEKPKVDPAPVKPHPPTVPDRRFRRI